MVKDIRSGSGSSSPSELIVNGNILYFRANEANNGEEVWKSDGTTTGTVMVKDIRSGMLDSTPRHLVVVDNVLYFEATDGTNTGIWKSDGTNSGTLMIKNVYPANELTAVGDCLYFVGFDGTYYYDIWRYDGTIQTEVIYS